MQILPLNFICEIDIINGFFSFGIKLLVNSYKNIRLCVIMYLYLFVMDMNLAYKFVDWMLHLEWSKVLDAHSYKIMAMSQTFVYSLIETISDLKYDIKLDKDDSYLYFKIIAVSIDNTILCESNEIEVSYSELEKFWISMLDWYNWTTLSFRGKEVYDVYKVYSKGSLIAETEDPILELLYRINKKELDDIFVEWYIKDENGGYILRWVSAKISRIPKRDKSKYKISVVIPVYNAQLFLSRTMDSILSSSMSDIEVILVDDGSKDNSLNICKWYAKEYPCVSVIHQKNQWVSVARNAWMKVAKGDYLWFVDSDDIIHPFMYENLYNACKITKTDIAISRVIIHNGIKDKELCLGMPGKTEDLIVYNYDELIDNIHNKDNMYFVAVWNKIVKTEIAKKVEFPVNYPNSIILYEDSAYTPTLYSYIDKFTLCKDAYYIWDKRQRKTIGTLSTRHKSEDVDNVWKAFIYAYAYPMYNRSQKHWELCDYACFKRLIESYDKFEESSSLYPYRNEKMIDLVKKNKLENNKLIMGDKHLRDVVNKLITLS